MIARPSVERRARCFVAYGVRVGLRTDDPAVLEAMDADAFRAALPPGWAPDSGRPDDEVAWYDVAVASSPGDRRDYTLHAGTERVAAPRDLAGVLRACVAHAELLIAEHAPAHLFVHAGVVAWQGRAVLVPGRSGAGKTTLVRACLAAGATYYSDEYAVLDRTGHVHPYARPLAIRGGSGEATRHVPAAALGAPVGIAPLPVGLVLVTTYRPAGRWRPRRLTPARALVALLGQTVAARGSPAHSMPILRQVVAATPALAGPRGEAAALVPALVARIGGDGRGAWHELVRGAFTPVPCGGTFTTGR